MQFIEIGERSKSSRFVVELTWLCMSCEGAADMEWSDKGQNVLPKICPYSTVSCYKKPPTKRYRGNLMRICLHKDGQWNDNSKTMSRKRTMRSKEQNLGNKSQEGNKWRWKMTNWTHKRKTRLQASLGIHRDWLQDPCGYQNPRMLKSLIKWRSICT